MLQSGFTHGYGQCAGSKVGSYGMSETGLNIRFAPRCFFHPFRIGFDFQVVLPGAESLGLFGWRFRTSFERSSACS
jgi:hypothetical protein